MSLLDWLHKHKAIGNRKEQPFGRLAAFLSYVYVAQRCMAEAVGLWREAAGAIDLACTPGAFQGFDTGPDLIRFCGLRARL